jgi:hypothetical protein
VEILLWPSIADTARELNVTRSRVDQLIAAGKLRIVHCRLGMLVDPASISEYAASRKPWRRSA